MGTSERREREIRQREATLLDAAAALLDREDWQSVTIDQIAARAEYAKGTVYKHFESKDEIYARLAIAWAAELQDALQGIDAARPFEAVLRDFVGVWWRHLGGGRVRARLGQFVRSGEVLAGLPAAARAALAEADARQLDLLAGLIELGVDEGALPDGPQTPRLFAAQALLQGAIRMSVRPEAGGAAPETMLADAVLALLRAPAAPCQTETARAAAG